jgi:hypothetical protein
MEAEEVYEGSIIRREILGEGFFGDLLDLQRGVEGLVKNVYYYLRMNYVHLHNVLVCLNFIYAYKVLQELMGDIAQ